MARKISISQLKSQLQQNMRKTNQAIRNYNNAVNNYNRSVNQAINKYNQAVRTHNANVQHNRSIINSELRKLQSASSTATVHVTYRASSIAMNNSYIAAARIGDNLVGLTPHQEQIYDLMEQEHANNLVTTNAIIVGDETPLFSDEDIAIGNKLARISTDLDARWRGAVFALNPANPDATRHFCTSSREIFTEAIELMAPDSFVFAFIPNCEKTDHGNATRRSKISYLLKKKGMDASVEQFVEDDITNILELFHVLSDGTHGEAGKYSVSKLQIVKKRVKDGINFLCSLAA